MIPKAGYRPECAFLAHNSGREERGSGRESDAFARGWLGHLSEGLNRETRGLTESNKEFVVVAVVKILHKISQHGKFRQHLVDFRGCDELGGKCK